MLIRGLSVQKLAGYVPSLPTPFLANDEVDYGAFEALCDKLVRGGAHGLVVGSTTGETSTLTRSEHIEIVRIAQKISRGRVPVIAGIGSNSTSGAIELARDAEMVGANASLCIVPYYNRPTQQGLFEHFGAIARATGLPLILYDAPARCACGLADDTIARLAENPQFIGLKDATGDIARVPRLRARLGAHFRLLSGDDATALGYFACGGNGCISVAANLAPGLCCDLYIAHRHGHPGRSQRIEAAVSQLTTVLL
jgi:4-hydroxy-tetrahydrodipicolinate synthase